MTFKSTLVNLYISCPFCKKGTISVTTTSEYYSYSISRISAKSERIPRYHKPIIEVHSKCPECGKSKNEIKEALERGFMKEIPHEERLKRIRDSGLPTRIEE